MARQPADVLAKLRHPQGRTVVWAEIRRRRDGFTVPAIADALKINRRTVQSYVESLTAAGYLSKCAGGGKVNGKSVPAAYRLARDCGREAPRIDRQGRPCIQGRAQEQLWRTMRRLRPSFDFRELAENASTPEVPVSAIAARDYLKHLAPHYLEVVEPPRLGKPARYRFRRDRDTGPLAPMVQRAKCVFDPNEGRVVGAEWESR